jgi:hypothetical protein
VETVIKKLENGQPTTNPFKVDPVALGMRVSKELWVMRSNKSTEPAEGVYLYNIVSGERFSISVNS